MRVKINPALPAVYGYNGAKPGDEVDLPKKEAEALMNLYRAGIPFAVPVSGSVEEGATSAEAESAPDAPE